MNSAEIAIVVLCNAIALFKNYREHKYIHVFLGIKIK